MENREWGIETSTTNLKLNFSTSVKLRVAPSPLVLKVLKRINNTLFFRKIATFRARSPKIKDKEKCV